jgi:carbonic anhydrase
MHRRQILQAFAGLALCPLCARAGLSSEGTHWSYEGPTGPSHWGDLDPAFRECSIGCNQTPISIGRAVITDLPSLGFAWARQADTIENNGHTIQLNFKNGGTLNVGSISYTLKQFHFHHPSEHIFGVMRFPVEAHFVHVSASGAVAVVAVMMTIGQQANPVFTEIVKTMPRTAGPPVAASAGIDPSGLLPAKLSYYRYWGSLSTPPCSEPVLWQLLVDPVTVNQASVSAFAGLYPNNARPVQTQKRHIVQRSR